MTLQGLNTPQIGDEHRWLFNGKEASNEHGLGWQDFGARRYDAQIGRWLGVDAMAGKFYSDGPYNFVSNGPILKYDPNGKEGIVISGSPGNPDNGGHSNKLHFLVNGLSKAKAAQNHIQNEGEKVTWIIYDDPTEGAGHNSKQLSEYKTKAEEFGIRVMIVTKSDEIVTYVNEKNGEKSREADKVTSFFYVGHALPGDLSVGYAGSGDNFEPDDFNSSAFSSGCHVNLVGGCRTAVPGWFEDSNVTQFQEILDMNSTIFGSNVRVQYDGGVISDETLLKENKGTLIKRKGELPVKK